MQKTNFIPKIPAIVVTTYGTDYWLEYLYSFGNCHVYRSSNPDTDPYKYTLDAAGNVINSTKGLVCTPWRSVLQLQAKTLHLRTIVIALKRLRSGKVSDLKIRSNYYEPLLNKRGYTARDGFLKSITDFCESRTQDRIDSGDYEAVPEEFPVQYGHGVHISTQDPSMLAYYSSNREILRDKAVKIRPGRYLKKYFPKMSDDEIRETSALIGAYTLTFHSSFEEMYEVYREMHDNGVVESCMSKDIFSMKLHPLRVYDESDVELAVLRDGSGNPVGRALYNSRTREYPMIYGQWEKMHAALKAAGFTHGSLDGAEVNRIDYDSVSLVMPYIDGHRPLDRSEYNATRINVHSGKCVIDSDGEHRCDTTNGKLVVVETKSCECCGDDTPEDEMYEVGYSENSYVCNYCYENNFIEVRILNGNTRMLPDGGDYCEVDGEYYYNRQALRDWGYIECQYDEHWYQADEVHYIPGLGDIYEGNFDSIYYCVETEEFDFGPPRHSSAECYTYLKLTELTDHFLGGRPNGFPKNVWSIL